MSKIGKQPLPIPGGVTVVLNGREITIKGKLGELKHTLPAGIDAKLEDNTLFFTRADDSRPQRSLHGLTRTLCANMVKGVAEGYSKVLIIEGTGFKAAVQGQSLMLSLGFANAKEYKIPAGIKVTEKQGVTVTVEGIDKQLVGQAAARIRSYYPVEPYKGKGIHYSDEHVRRKQGKKLA